MLSLGTMRAKESDCTFVTPNPDPNIQLCNVLCPKKTEGRVKRKHKIEHEKFCGRAGCAGCAMRRKARGGLEKGFPWIHGGSNLLDRLICRCLARTLELARSEKLMSVKRISEPRRRFMRTFNRREEFLSGCKLI